MFEAWSGERGNEPAESTPWQGSLDAFSGVKRNGAALGVWDTPAVNGFATLPFDEQLALVARAAREPGAAEALLREAGALPDSEPLARLVDALAEAGRVDEALRATLAEVLERLPDPALQQLLEEPGAAAAPLLEGLAFDALRTWPITRPSALAFLVRWLRRRDPAAHARLMEEAHAATDGPPTEGRWLLFVSGARLAALSEDPGWGPRVVETVRLAVDALARAPKSISQANAETLLARRVYADPGHFLFELLQNADDAGATEWSARVEADRAVIANDGAPFSFLDLVGVLSIGLTTKAAQQIGFFGVGFKSVYEVCERPRIHSGAFDVEIAHVSIPRVLATRPTDMDAGSTALVLPFSDAVDADALFRRALAIPPETLLTLPHLERIELTGPDGARVRWRQRAERGSTVLSDQALTEGAPRRFRITERRVRFEGEREEGRARESRVLVAVSVDDDGAPRPLSGPTLFAFLPTAERTGLRVLVHARFDVTVDRERVERGSAWNDALLDAAGHAIADAALELVSDGHDPLAILSAPDDAAPAVATLMAAIRSRLHHAPCLPAADGSWISPTRARIVAPSLARALASLDLGDDPDVERTIDFTRDCIEEQFGIPAYRIVLMFEGEKLLQLDALLEDYNVDDGDSLWVIVDTRAKKPRRKKKRGKKGEMVPSQAPAVPTAEDCAASCWGKRDDPALPCAYWKWGVQGGWCVHWQVCAHATDAPAAHGSDSLAAPAEPAPTRPSSFEEHSTHPS